MDLNFALIIYKADNDESYKAANNCASALREIDCKYLMGPSGPNDNPYRVFLKSTWESIDIAFVFGGDGTVLGAARNLVHTGVPIMAFKAGGHLGFLTESVPQFGVSFCDLLRTGQTVIDRRRLVEAYTADSNGNKTSPEFYALNEICIKPASADRMLTSILEVSVEGNLLDQYQGDGLLVSSPTGSTCYALAANGPILHPELKGIIVAPICPLSLSSRPLVLPIGVEVGVKPINDDMQATKIWTDGVLAHSIKPDETVYVCSHKPSVEFIRTKKIDYFQTLKTKLGWAGTNVHYGTTLKPFEGLVNKSIIMTRDES